MLQFRNRFAQGRQPFLLPVGLVEEHVHVKVFEFLAQLQKRPRRRALLLQGAEPRFELVQKIEEALHVLFGRL